MIEYIIIISRMEQRKRIYIFITFFICTSCLALLTLSLATHRWIIARPIRLISLNSSTIFQLNDYDEHTEIELPKKFRGFVYFGLFQGTKVLNYGLGDRTTIIWCKYDHLYINQSPECGGQSHDYR